MELRVIKYNGKLQKFDKYKIEDSIKKAAKSAKEEIPEFMVKRIANNIEEDIIKENIDKISADKIANRVETKLMESKYKETAKKYIKFHYDRQKERLYNFEIIKAFQKKLNGFNIENSNANCDERSFSGRINEAATIMLKDNALHNMSANARNNHNNNIIYIHDLNSYSAAMHNCLSIPFDELLHKDLYTKQTGIRPPRSIQTACQLVAVIIQVQSLQQFGGVSSTHLDWTLVPFVRYTFFKHMRDGHKYITKDTFKMPKDIENTSIDDYKDDPCYQYAYELTDRDTKQGAEGLIHNLNSLQSRSGNQLPFSSINYGTCTLTEGRMICHAILDCTISGTGPLHETPIFPCGIFQYMKGVNDAPGTPNYDIYKKALYSTAKRFYPNYCLTTWSVNNNGAKVDRQIKRNVISKLEKEDYDKLLAWIRKNPTEAKKINLTNEGRTIIVSDELNPFEINSTMGCRTMNGIDANFTEDYFKDIINTILTQDKLPESELYSAIQKDGRGNIAPATIILPSVAMLVKGEIGNKNLDSFMNKLERKIEECKNGLIERFTHIAEQSPASATFMYFNRTMFGYHPEEGIISALKHGTLAIGQLGLAECLQILIGKDQTEPEGMELAKKIEDLFNRKCAEFKKVKYNINGSCIYLNFGVYYTPAESLCFTAMNKFKEQYGEIPKISDKKFFTNSMHVPVWHNITPFEKIDLEAQLTGYSNAGCITYVELEASAYNNIKALEKLVNYAMSKDIPYFALNPVIDSCRECGYSGEIEDKCPKCGSDRILRLRRVTGYISNDAFTAFNEGKIDEVLHRATHVGDTCSCCD